MLGWVGLVLTIWRDGSIACGWIVVLVLIFVIFEEVWVNVPNVDDFHVGRYVPKFERKNFDWSDERRTRD